VAGLTAVGPEAVWVPAGICRNAAGDFLRDNLFSDEVTAKSCKSCIASGINWAELNTVARRGD